MYFLGRLSQNAKCTEPPADVDLLSTMTPSLRGALQLFALGRKWLMAISVSVRLMQSTALPARKIPNIQPSASRRTCLFRSARTDMSRIRGPRLLRRLNHAYCGVHRSSICSPSIRTEKEKMSAQWPVLPVNSERRPSKKRRILFPLLSSNLKYFP